MKVGKFQTFKILETLQFRAIPSANSCLVLELARSSYLATRENTLALGHSGTSNTHLAFALWADAPEGQLFSIPVVERVTRRNLAGDVDNHRLSLPSGD
jgi:DNA replication protein DnaC